MKRRGLTLIEVLVVIAIIAILMGLTMAAIQNARAANLRLRSMNKIRQIGLAFQNYESSKGDLPSIQNLATPTPGDRAPFAAILPFIEYKRDLFLSPADPSLEFVHPSKPFYPGIDTDEALSSYAYNALVFVGKTQLGSSIRDGTSNTIGIAEHYARCAEQKWVVFIFSLLSSSGAGGSRRPSFADAYYGDVVPITKSGNTPVTVPSVSGMTFQASPGLMESDATLPQTPHSTGMLIGLMDGSARLISRNVSAGVFWSAVTPSGGEVHSEF